MYMDLKDLGLKAINELEKVDVLFLLCTDGSKGKFVLAGEVDQMVKALESCLRSNPSVRMACELALSNVRKSEVGLN